MVLPNSNSMHQQKWQQKPNRSQNRSNKSNRSTAKKTHSTSSINTISNSSSVSELPETFGLPSNQSSKSSLLSKHTSSTNLEKSDIIIDDSEKSPQKSDDIEIISEINTNQNSDDLNLNLKNYIKNYSLKNLNLPIATKPQSNFVSNFNLIDQLIRKSEFYTNKLKRCKPYSNIKANQIISMESDDSDEDDTNVDKVIRNKKVILIDDSNEEMHKPWITPELIKLIKHRNLLQSKLQSDTEANNPELMKKFKNLRNKVTKLVKKARKEYLTKYIQESKENKIKLTEENTKTVSTGGSQETKIQNESEKKSPQKECSTENEQKSAPLATTSNQNVNEITKKLTAGSFLKDTSTLMMSLYTNYFNEYMQQYTKQQQQAQELANKINDKAENEEAYDSLKKQAAVYAQQQLVIQQQLEKSLIESSQQLIQEIAEAAANKANQPFVLNQFSQQQHMHHHMHLSAQIGQPMMSQATMMGLVPPPPPSSTNIPQTAPIGMPPKVYY